MTSSIWHFVRNKRVGPILWLLCFQFPLVEYLVSLGTTFPYSRTDNYISDLGSVHCAVLTSGFTAAAHRVCSPFHNWLNASFVLEGTLAGAGAFFMRKLLPTIKLMRFSLILLYITGVGFAMAGFAPNDVNLPVHYTGAVFALLGGGMGMVLFGAATFTESSTFGLALLTLASGILSLTGTVLLSSGMTLGIGVGGMERIAAYPYLVWLTLTGMYYLARPVASR